MNFLNYEIMKVHVYQKKISVEAEMMINYHFVDFAMNTGLNSIFYVLSQAH